MTKEVEAKRNGVINPQTYIIVGFKTLLFVPADRLANEIVVWEQYEIE